jgi:hypothetical protein
MRKRRRAQRLSYFLWFLSPWNWLWGLFALLGLVLNRISFHLYQCGNVDGITLSSLDDKPTTALFVLRTQEALDSLATHCPSSSRLVHRYLKKIRSSKQVGGGTWVPFLKVAQVDFSTYAPSLRDPQSQDYPYYLACYAARLVGIATQAHLQAQGFIENETNWRRFAALSQRISRRCIKSLLGYEDTPEIRDWIRAVDLEWLEGFRTQTYWQKLKLIPQRLGLFWNI